MATVRLRGVGKSFGGSTSAAVEDVTLDVDDGAFVTFVGPSGCGKSTTLRMIAGLEATTSGEIWIGDRLANDIHPADRDVAMVFQSYALYPHMSVHDNIPYGLKRRGVERREIAARVEEVAALLQLGELLQRKPSQLSGGQRQRVALGRAIVRRPAVFLMDEPLSNLDAQLRVGMRTELLRLHAKLGITTIYVTHDQVEAMTMAERVVVMNKGRVEQHGPPLELYHRPQTLFVAKFLGTPPMNLISGAIGLASGVARFSGRDFALDLPDCASLADRTVVAAIRPQQLLARPQGDVPSAGQARLGTANIDVVEHYGPESFATLSADGQLLTATVDPASQLATGDAVHVWTEPAAVLLFDAATGRRLGGEPATPMLRAAQR
jgi:ABC-type sugar transport system ATPase subunit